MYLPFSVIMGHCSKFPLPPCWRHYVWQWKYHWESSISQQIVSEIRAKTDKLLWKICKNFLKIIIIGNPEKIKENNINLMEIPELKKFQSHRKTHVFQQRVTPMAQYEDIFQQFKLNKIKIVITKTKLNHNLYLQKIKL